MSKKYNTTRQRVLGVATRGRTQVVFYDTPGIVAAEDRGRYFRPLVVSAAETVPLADVVVFVVDLAQFMNAGAQTWILRLATVLERFWTNAGCAEATIQHVWDAPMQQRATTIQMR